ncbi:hypothetical protein MAINES_00850 [Brevundimonas phage vB_BpoS-MaInes]|nr:hypothetical protein MAINES_00850 [Brevundimonas phage vB_BpoS-MaInes]
MARFAPVAPVHILQEMSPETFGDYHLFLAHHTVEKPGDFDKLLLKNIGRQHLRDLTIIMDNSIVELGGAVDDAMVLDAVKIVRHTVNSSTKVIPCLPDVMGSASETWVLSEEAYHNWGKIHNGNYKDGMMIVTQGETFGAFARVVNYFLASGNFPHITWAGIPRYIMKQWDERTRQRAVHYINMVAPHVKIHLLGFSDDIFDDMRCARMPGVVGIDSAVPVRYDGILTPITSDEDIGPRGEWFEKGRLTPTAIRNIHAARMWAKYK